VSEIDLEKLADEVRREHRASQKSKEGLRGAIGFWRKVARGEPNECWPWTGFKKKSGHGLTSYKSLPIHASRKAYILTHGPIEVAKCVLHTCDNAACCNPTHLYLGTRADNMIDRFDETPAAERSARGRPTVLDAAQLERLWKLRRAGLSLKECAMQFDVHIATICRYITNMRRQKLDKIRADRLALRKNAGI
jgi:hypothetical protein